MTAALKEAMRNALDNLTEADFKRFKHYLRDQGRFAWGKLEKADTNDAVDMMVDANSMQAGDLMVTILQKMNHNQLAMDLKNNLPKLSNYGQGPSGIQKGGQEFFNKHKWDLETRLGVLPPLLIELERSGVLSRHEREKVQCERTSHEQNHVLIDMIERKGAMAKEKFYQALQAHEAYLVEDLQRSAM